MFETVRNAFKIKDLRKKILYTLFILVVVRIGCQLPIPGVDADYISQWFADQNSLDFFNQLTGGSFERMSIFALNITPYITSSIILQLLTIAIPRLEELHKDGEEGRKKISEYTRYVTIALSLMESAAMAIGFASQDLLTGGTTFSSITVCIVSMTAGSALLMWLGEQITEFGIGNGISIILFVSIVARFPNSIIRQINNVANGDLAWWVLVLMYLGALLLIVLIVLVNDAERRLPVQYSKRVVGRKMYGGQSTHLPMKVNMSGVLPIIFAQSIASLPATVCAFVPKWQNSWGMTHVFNTTTWPYIVIYFLLIIFFSYFYSTIQFNPIEVANNLKKNGGFIPGFRAGKPTSEFIQKVLNKITLFGAIYLSVIAITPLIISACSKAEELTGISLGGTSIIIVVGVALETVRALEAQMLMRNYKGFLS